MSSESNAAGYASMVKTAKDAVEGMDEPLKSLAFQKILDDLLGKNGAGSPAGAAAKPKARVRRSPARTDSPSNSVEDGAADSQPDPVQKVMQADIDHSEYDALFDARGNLENKSLAVLVLVRDQCGIADGLTPQQITRLLKDKFRVSGVYSSNVSLQLGKARSLFNRTPVGPAFRYKSTRAGDKQLADAVKALKAE